MSKRRIDQLSIGDKILPPPREIQLWMKRELQNRNLSESALHLTITSIEEASPDKRGRWVVISADQSPEWFESVNGKPYPFRFKARPETLWQMV